MVDLVEVTDQDGEAQIAGDNDDHHDLKAYRAQYSPVVHLPRDYEVFDLTGAYDPNRNLQTDFGIGKYNEKRPRVYNQDLFLPDKRDDDLNHRHIHMGIDIAAPVGTDVHAFYDGVVYCRARHAKSGDYGPTIILQHQLGSTRLWSLYGHLSAKSLSKVSTGQVVKSGEVLGWIGNKEENGGWNPHVHFQLSYMQPQGCDLPGAVSQRELAEALQIYPDPRLVLGELY